MTERRQPAVLCDLDGTLASCGWRRHHVTSARPEERDWAAFFAGIPADAPVPVGRSLLEAIRPGVARVLVSARPEPHRELGDAPCASQRRLRRATPAARFERYDERRQQGCRQEPREPNHAGNAGGRSVWYRWKAAEDGTAVFDTFGSSFDTLLAVYRGSRLDELELVVANDDTQAPLPVQNQSH